MAPLGAREGNHYFERTSLPIHQNEDNKDTAALRQAQGSLQHTRHVLEYTTAVIINWLGTCDLPRYLHSGICWMMPVLLRHFTGTTALLQLNMSVWPSSPAVTTIVTPLTLLCIVLIIRLRSNPFRFHALLLTLVFLPVQHFSLSHPTPLARSALQHRQLICATVGAALHTVAIAIVAVFAYGLLALAGMLIAILLFTNEQRLDPRIQNFFKELSSRLNINWTYTTRFTTTTSSTPGATVSTTVTNTEQLQQHPTGEHADLVDKLIHWASVILPVAARIPEEFANAITPFIMSPSHTLLLMGSPNRVADVASVFDIIQLATAGAVGLWYTRSLFASMWNPQNATSAPRAVLSALKPAWWFLLGVIAQVYVSANIARRDLFHSGPSVFGIGWLVFQFRFAIRVVEAVQGSLRERSRNLEICMEGVKAFFVTYFAVVSWRVVLKVLSLEAAKYATA